jgi:hypothetical protein
MADDGAATAGTAVQLIDGEGGFATDSAERFMAAAGVAECGLSYAVVSIMGPQSSGTYVRYVLRSVIGRMELALPSALAGHVFDQMHPHCGRSVACSVLCIGRSIRLTARLMRLLDRPTSARVK